MCLAPYLGESNTNRKNKLVNLIPILSDESVLGGGKEEVNNSSMVKKCCSGLCVDLLRKFQDDLGFSYELIRAEDPKWGTLEVGFFSGSIEITSMNI